MKIKSSGAGVMFMQKKSRGAGTVSFLRRIRCPEIIHAAAGHVDNRRSRVKFQR